MNFERFSMSTCVVLGLFTAGCDRTFQPQQQVGIPEVSAAPTASQSTDHQHPTTVDWKTVDTFDQLVGASDLVAQGTVVERRFVNRRMYGYSPQLGRTLTPDEAGQSFADLRLTESTVRLDQVARASERAGTSAAGETIVVSELGGQLDDGCIAVPDDKPLLEVGDHVVLFLSSAGKRGGFHQVGGWQGRMYVADGVIHPLAKRVHPSAIELARYDGMGVKEFLTLAANRHGAPLPENEGPPGTVIQ